MTTDQKKEKLRKLKELAERGVGGERENAGAFFDKLLLKWDIDPDDIGADSDVLNEEIFFVFSLDELIILKFVISYVTEGRIIARSRTKDSGIYAYAVLSKWENAQVRAFWELTYEAWLRTVDKVDTKHRQARSDMKWDKQYHRKKLKELERETKEMYKAQKAERKNIVSSFVFKNDLCKYMKKNPNRKLNPMTKTDEQGFFSAMTSTEEIDTTKRFGAQSLPCHD